MADELTELQSEDERRGAMRRLGEWAARRAGASVVDDDRLMLMEAEVEDRRVLRRELDLLAYTALDYMGGNEQDLKAVARRRLVQQARVAWQQDPQLGAAVDLMNDFTLGRGIPRPKARDEKVQEILDEAWEDEDNELTLTSYPAQLALGTDLSIQSNVFILLFSGDDGRVKLGMLEHDTVEDVVKDTNYRRRILYYKTRQKQITWDYENDRPKAEVTTPGNSKVKYFQHWRNEPPDGMKAPSNKLGEGRVYHVSVNRTGEMAFGHPTMHRVLRWANAFNGLMEARVDAARAAAAFMMKRKVKGTPSQLHKTATQILSKRGELGRSGGPGGFDPDADAPIQAGPGAGSIMNENEGVEHSPFKLDSGAQGANVDGQMLRSQISAATHFPQHYLGDIGSANLATATSMELPVLKAVESRQEIIEQIFRWFFDRVIEEALESGRLTEELSGEEWHDRQDDAEKEGQDKAAPASSTAEAPPSAGALGPVELGSETDTSTGSEAEEPEIPDDVPDDERMRDLGYDFSLPSPLRRMMSDLVAAISTIARTFDPNGTNMELARVLLSIALGEGLEMNEPSDVVDKVFPPGYRDPLLTAQLAAVQPQAINPFAPPPGAGPASNGNGAPQGENNPYSAPMNGSTPETNPYGTQEARLQAQGGVLLDPRGAPWVSREDALLREGMLQQLTPEAREKLDERMRAVADDWDRDVGGAAMDEIFGGNDK